MDLLSAVALAASIASTLVISLSLQAEGQTSDHFFAGYLKSSS
jgi:hypothetical protein